MLGCKVDSLSTISDRTLDLRLAIDKRISNFPAFNCYRAYDLGMKMPNSLACALLPQHRISQKLTKTHGAHWPIIFGNFRFFDLSFEMIVYHELAHFIAHDIQPIHPSHGLLWAVCCDALQKQMDMDPISMLEGATWLSELTEHEKEETLASDGMCNLKEWSVMQVRWFSIVADQLDHWRATKIPYEVFCDIIRLGRTKALGRPTISLAPI